MTAATSSPNHRRWLGGLAVVGVVVAVIAGSALLRVDEKTVGSATPNPAADRTRRTEPETPGESSDPAARATGVNQAPDRTGPASTATDTLESFMAAAKTLDNQLHAAAATINAAGPPWVAISDEVRDSVRDAEIGPVANAIPAGMPDELLQSVIAVYSDLVSRRGAMESFTYERDAVQPLTDDMLLAELGNGHAAAVRFDRDLDALASLASSTPAFTVPPGDSRAHAEVSLHTQYVDLLNSGCDGRGGAIITELPSIEWGQTVRGSETADGLIGVGDAVFDFTAELGSDGTWSVGIVAC